jgi:hypothetical protein
MKKWIKKWGAAVLVLVMLLSVLAPANVQAATKTETLTLYKGEKTAISVPSGKIKSVTSSQKSVVTAKKEKGSTRQIDFVAKKTGSATVTVKTTKGTRKYKITVKELDITGSVIGAMPDGVLEERPILAITNNTAQTFTSVVLTYTLRDKAGNKLKTGTKTVRNVVSKATVYDTVYHSMSYQSDTIDASKCTVTVKSAERTLGVIYKNKTAKLTCKTTVKKDDGSQNITIKIKNPPENASVTVTVYFLKYDSSGEAVSLSGETYNLEPGGSSQLEKTVGEGLTYEVVPVAFSYTF